MNNLKDKLFSGRGSVRQFDSPWRVNLVNAETLPDIKVIRTSFLINYGCVAIALAAVGYAVNQEMQLREAHAELEKTMEQSSRLVTADATVRQQAALCAEYLAYLDEFTKYKTPGIDVFSLYGQLGQLKADDLKFENVLVDTTGVDAKKRPKAKIVISGRRKGVSGQSFERIGAVYKTFLDAPLFKEKLVFAPKPAKSPQTVPDTQEQVVNFTFESTLELK